MADAVLALQAVLASSIIASKIAELYLTYAFARNRDANTIVEFIGGRARAHKTHSFLCCTQKENLDEHHGIDWHTCYKIIVGISEGLAYIHRQQKHFICHCDVKPANILLDANMESKISDFGLSSYCREKIVGTDKIVKYNGRILLSDKIDRLICFENLQNGSLGVYLSVEHSRLDWNTRLKIFAAICGALVYLHEEPRIRVCHLDFKPENILLDDDMVPKIANFGLSWCFGEELARNTIEHSRLDWRTRFKIFAAICGASAYLHEEPRIRVSHLDFKPENILLDDDMVPKIADFGLSRCFGEELARNTSNCIGSRGYIAPELNERIISYKSDIYSLGVIIMSIWTGYEEILQRYYWREIVWMLESYKSRKVTRSTVSSTQRAVHNSIVPDSDVRISATVDVPKMKPSPACINMDKAPSTAEDSVVLVLDSGSSALAPAPSMHRHQSHSNLTEERSNKPISNRAPQTNSSDDQTRAPMEPNKLTDDEAHSEPNSSVDERDTNEEARRSGKWFVATGAAHHATGDRGLITNLLELENDSLCVHAADGTPMPVRGRGNVETDNLVLPDVYYVPGLWTNLVSVGQLAGLDYCVGFSRGACHVSDAAGTVVGTAHARGDGLYEVDHLRVPLDMR